MSKLTLKKLFPSNSEKNVYKCDPCKYCGEKAKVEFWEPNGKGTRPSGYHVKCDHKIDCYYCGVFVVTYAKKIDCVKAWNRKP